MSQTQRPADREPWAVDLFCGVGGLTHGLSRAGVKVAAGIDIDANCKYAYESNNSATFIQKDISKVTADEISRLFPEGSVRILGGCAPCQPFSALSQGRDPTKDEKWGLLGHFGRLVKESEPDYVTMENVPQIRTQGIFRRFERTLTDLGYHVARDVLFCPDYGVPQERSRLVLLASQHGPIDIPPRTHAPDEYASVRQTISCLPRLRAGKADKEDPVHRAAGLTPINMRRIKASKPGGTWRDWDAELVLDCHKKKTGKSYSGVYGRMRWDAPGPTITTEFYNLGSGRFGHPEQNRALSLREGALLQTFPQDYAFVGPGQEIHLTPMATLIGNAVPVRLGEVIGKAIVDHVRGGWQKRRGQQQLPRSS
jgi:DNA (cytosine-5)-methyltransferase 1